LENFPINSPHFEEKMNGFANIFGEVEQILSFLILKLFIKLICFIGLPTSNRKSKFCTCLFVL
jgi:hypothetical protein